MTNSQVVSSFQGTVRASPSADCLEYKDNVEFLGSSHSTRQTLSLPNLDSARTGYSPDTSHLLTNNTSVGGITPSVGSDFTQTNNERATTVAGVSNIWNGAGSTGARVCKRYKDGVLTSENLWPWPMNQRIKDATDFAGTAYDVEAELEAIFGAIPAGCGG